MKSIVIEIIRRVRAEKIKLEIDKQGSLLLKSNSKSIVPELLADIKEHKEDIIQYLKKYSERSLPVQKKVSIPKRQMGKKERIPLSYAQERLWFIHKLHGSVQYHQPLVLRIDGQFKKEFLETSFREIANRHEILRTVYKEEKGQAYQHVLPKNTLHLSHTDSPKKDLDQYVEQLIKVPFDLTSDHMLRCHLISLRDDQHLLVIVTHHIANDGWSFPIFVKELVTVFKEKVSGVPQPLPQLPVQYADYAVWQRKHLNEEVLRQKLDYWEDTLDGLETLQLPTDYQRPPISSVKGALCSREINKEIVQGIRDLCHENEATLFMALLACFKVLLYRYSGQSDICVGSSVANRTSSEVESLIGFFVNTLPFRSKLNGNTGFLDLLEQVKESTLAAYDHQDVPFEHIVNRVLNKRDTGRNPLFDVIFTLQNNEQTERFELEEISLKPHYRKHITAQFDLNFMVTERSSSLVVNLEYSSDLYSEARMNKMLEHYEHLLTEIVADPLKSINNLTILSAAEREKLLTGLNTASTTYPREKSTVDLFKQQVAKTPDRIALIDGKEKYTYDQLDSRSDRLAYLLKTQYDIKNGDLIGMMISRSHWAIVSILGILKAGGCYVPMDENYPHKRKAFICGDTRMKAMVTLSDNLIDASELGPKVCCIDIQLDSIAIQEFDDVAVLSGTHPAYVMYTSGSTGTPKGVIVNHRNILRLIFNSHFDFLNEETVLYHYAPLSFDASTFEIWGALLSGGRLVIGPPTQNLDSLAESVQLHRVNTLWLTAGLFHAGVTDNLDLFKGLSFLLAGGDSIDPGCVKKLLATYPKLTFINGYGPTECTTFSVVNRINTETEVDLKKNIIGKPIDNTTAYVLDNANNLMPEGMPGELCIGGDGVSIGYLNNPSLTSCSFNNHLFNGHTHEKLYRTGDRARWLPNGSLEYLGRNDDQIKLRGYRVELGEIAYALNQHVLVEQSVVIVNITEDYSKQLVAYIVSNAKWDKELLNGYLSKHLPSHMIPSLYVGIDVFPLTHNGKIDKEKLPKPGDTRLISATYQAPVNNNERKLVEIWEELLEVQRVGVNDDFFELGGDSIKSIRLASRIGEVFGFEVKIRDLFAHSTVRNFSTFISTTDFADRRVSDPYEKIATRLDVLRTEVLDTLPDASEVEDIYPMSDIQKGMIFESLKFPELGVYHDQIVYPLDIPVFDVEVFEQALRMLMAKHSIFRTRFDLHREEPLQLVYKSSSPSFKYHDISGIDKHSQKYRITSHLDSDREKSFDFAKGPLFRCDLFKVGEVSYVCTFQFHHAILDGWSLASFNTELYDLYKRLQSDPEAAPARIQCTQRDYIIRELAQKENDANITFWKQELSGLKELDIFTSESVTLRHSHFYESDFLRQLKSHCKNDGITLKALLMGTFMYGLNMLSYDNDLVMGLVSHMRPPIEDGDKLLGCFLNSVPVRKKFHHAEASWLSYFKNIQAKLEEVQLHDQLTLVEINKHANAEAEQPIFNTLFGFLDFHIYDLLGTRKEQRDTQQRNTAIQDSSQSNINSYVRTNSNFELNIDLTGGEGAYFQYVLNRSLKSEVSLTEFHQYIDEILQCYLHKKDVPVSREHILSSVGKNKILKPKASRKLEPKANTLVDLFELRVSETPDAVAIRYGDESITYGALDTKVNVLRDYLVSTYSLNSDDRVGLLLDNSPWTIISILGILKSGLAYVPIDVNYPVSRQQFLVADADIRVLITQSEYLFAVADLKAPVFCIDVQLSTLPNTDLAMEVRKPKANDLAYIIYTSGSTGKPKGVMVNHGSLVNYYNASCERYLKGNSCFNFPLFTSISFDLTQTSIFLSLLTGGELSIMTTSDIGASLEQIFSDETISHVKITPSHIGLLEGMENSTLSGVIVGGEALTSSHVEQLRAVHPHITIYNEYGPTEATIGCSVFEITEKTILKKDNVSIGQPIRNTEIHILDSELQLVPVGVWGELCVTGSSIARGYLNRNELTDKRFVNNPFDPAFSAKMYRTGDRVRWLSDGTLEYGGRLDDQIKLRGYRIELGEVENAILSFPGIKKSAVLVKEDEKGTSLIGCYVREEEEAFCEGPYQKQIMKYELPNGLSLHALNKSELDYVYKEIFTEHSYLKNGIHIPKGGCVVDVGANIGTFSVYAALMSEQIEIYSFEPLPPTFAALRMNTKLYEKEAGFHIFNCGLSNQPESVTFTHYPNASVLSSRYVEREEAFDTVRQVIVNKEGNSLDQDSVEELLEEMLLTEEYECDLKTLSQVIAEEKIETIDLLKIDAEKSEQDVLDGIKEEDWARVKQIVMEVHDDEQNRLQYVCEMLKRRGYEVFVEQNKDVSNTRLYDVYAISQEYREYQNRAKPSLRLDDLGNYSLDGGVKEKLRQYLLGRLPEYMVPLTYMEIDAIPLTAHGKIDKSKLLEKTSHPSRNAYVAPGNDIEEFLVGLWETLLKVDRIGVNDDFFELGGHSLLAVRMMMAIKRKWDFDLELKALFDSPTIEAISHHIEIKLNNELDMMQEYERIEL